MPFRHARHTRAVWQYRHAMALTGPLATHPGTSRDSGPGTYVFGPRGHEHTFLVRSETARMTTLLLPGTCEEFFHSTGHRATSLTLPPPSEPDMATLIEGMARFGIEMVGPPPRL